MHVLCSVERKAVYINTHTRTKTGVEERYCVKSLDSRLKFKSGVVFSEGKCGNEIKTGEITLRHV